MWRTLLVAALLVFAGCATEPPGSGVDADEPGANGTGASDADTNGANEDTATERRALTTDAATNRSNPWGKGELTVAIENAANESRNFRPLVSQALDFWSENSSRYAGFPIGFELVSNASNPDVVVEFVERIDSCANVTDPAGCAPFVTGGNVSRPVTVDVVGSYSNESTLLVVTHELGHVLGLNHSAEPQSVMAPSSALSTLPQPNATERRLPWNDSNLTVFLDASWVDDRDEAREQVRRALDFYADGANGTVPTNVSFELVENRTAADVQITLGNDDLPCRIGERGSCGRVRGIDPDGDDALEQYDRLRITVGKVDAEAVGWHVGYWLGYGFGFDDDADWPEPFRNASHDDRRSEWWNAS
ncbi:M57 family metalloprotease [Halorussus litoreus]|uniref:M57 family metalloprotease n=1 Tax=Halorussus litoreus TaxID=1710536 RepID=UPI000E26276A|nr:M57 family metalloprotease [Halorussus litoreus]